MHLKFDQECFLSTWDIVLEVLLPVLSWELVSLAVSAEII